MKHKKEIKHNLELNCYEVKATQDQWFLIDLDDYDLLEKYNWYAKYDNRGGDNYYIETGKTIPLHRLLLNFPVKPLSGDHINRNTLDNRKVNLRVATKREQKINQNIRKDNKSGFKGVYYHKKNNKWQGRIHNNEGIRINKSFETKEDAIAWRRLKEQEFNF